MSINLYNMAPSRESEFEQTLLREFRKAGYESKHGSNLNRESTHDVVLKDRLKQNVLDLNPDASEYTVQKVVERFTQYESQNRRRENKNKYEQITQGITVENEDETFVNHTLIDFENPENNQFLVVNQFTVQHQNNDPKTPDLVVFINGIPIGVFELKTIDNKAESLQDAYNQITDRYYLDIPNLFYYTQFIAVADENSAKVGSHTAPWEWMSPWRYIEKEPENKENYDYSMQYLSLIHGLFNKTRCLDVIKNYVLFENSTEPNKLTPAYYQYYGVENAINNSIQKLGKVAVNNQDRKIGTVSHSQGSGKSVSIAFYINKLKKTNPNILFVAVTDTNDLDEQLHNETLENYGLSPTHIKTIDELRSQLKSYQKGGGGIITTTIQKFQLKESKRAREALNKSKNKFNHTRFSKYRVKQRKKQSIEHAEELITDKQYSKAMDVLENLFISYDQKDSVIQSDFDVDEEYLEMLDHPELNQRDDIIIISDEAHRSQDKSLGRNLRVALPNAAQIGFTATPVYDNGTNKTAEWFGEEISSYMMDQAVSDGSVVQIDYENRSPKLRVDVDELQKAYDETDEQTAFEKVSFEDILKTEERQRKIAKDIVDHFNNRELAGKAMLVAPDREAAVDYHQYIQQLNDSDEFDSVPESHPIISSAGDFGITYDEDLESRFKNSQDPFNLAIVCDKWTTGFNVKHLHTMYIDKPLRGHNLVQTLGRVNRTHNNKSSGLIIDYVGLSESKNKAFEKYTTGNSETSSIQTDVEELESEFKQSLAGLKSIVSIPEDISNWNVRQKKEPLVHQAMDEVKKKGETREFLETFKELQSAYKRIHPCTFTEEHYYEIMFLIRVGSRLSVIEDENMSRPEPEAVKGVDKLINESVEAEEAVKIDMIEEGTVEQNISNPGIDIPRVSEGIKDKLTDRSAYSLKTYKEIKEDIESTVEDYNHSRIDENKAVHKLERALETLNKEEEQAEEFDLTIEQMSLFRVLCETTTLDEKQASVVAKEIDKLLDSRLTTDWNTRQDVKNEMELKVCSILEKEHNIDESNDVWDISESIVEIAEEVY